MSSAVPAREAILNCAPAAPLISNATRSIRFPQDPRGSARCRCSTAHPDPKMAPKNGDVNPPWSGLRQFSLEFGSRRCIHTPCHPRSSLSLSVDRAKCRALLHCMPDHGLRGSRDAIPFPPGIQLSSERERSRNYTGRKGCPELSRGGEHIDSSRLQKVSRV